MLALTFINCEKDNLIQEPIEQQISTLNIKAYTFTTDSIFKVNKDLKNLISNKFNPKNNGVASRLTSNTYGFSIDTSYVQLLVSDTYESFTFVVERDEPIYGVLENYVLTLYNEGNYSQMLIGYPITETENGIDYDIANASIEVIDDETLLYSRCNYSYEEIIGWDENAGECVEWPCASNIHWGSAQADDCTLSGSDLPYDQCSGGWVVTGCNPGGGTPTDGTDPTDGTTGGGTSGTGEETEEEVAVVPFEPQYLENIIDCINGTLIIGQTNNTVLTESMISWLDGNRLTYQIDNYLQSNSCSEESQEFAVLAVEALADGGEVSFEELYISVDTPDDDYVYQGSTQLIPNPLVLTNGEDVTVTFITYTNDGLSSNQQVSIDLVDGMKFALEQANQNLSLSEKITSINIYATTNGNHTGPNHPNGTAVDINRINGNRMAETGLTNQIIELQKAFDNFTYIRENFGSYFKHKFSVENPIGNQWNYNHPVGNHISHIHISVRR